MAKMDYATPVWVTPPPNPALSVLAHLTGAGSTLLASSPGWLSSICVNTFAGSAATLTVYDGIDATGQVLGIVDVSKQSGVAGGLAPWPFLTGLFVVLSGAADITIVARKSGD